LLEIITANRIPPFEGFVSDWLTDCNGFCAGIEEESCVQDACIPIYPYPGQIID